MKPTLQLKLSQHLTLTPQLQQSIRLLQLSTLELNAEVERLLQENPLLEKADEDESAGPPREFTPRSTTPSTRQAGRELRRRLRRTTADLLLGARDGDWGSSSGGSDDDDETFLPQQVATSSLRDHLNSQLALLNLPLRDRQIVAALIDALDEDGYLTTSLEELLELFPEEIELEADELSIALRHLQNMEPAGVGARDAAECLSLQLKALPESTPFRGEALKLVQTSPAAPRRARFRQAQAPAPHRRRLPALRAHADHEPQSPPRCRFLQDRGELCDTGRGRT